MPHTQSLLHTSASTGRYCSRRRPEIPPASPHLRLLTPRTTVWLVSRSQTLFCGLQITLDTVKLLRHVQPGLCLCSKLGRLRLLIFPKPACPNWFTSNSVVLAIARYFKAYWNWYCTDTVIRTQITFRLMRLRLNLDVYLHVIIFRNFFQWTKCQSGRMHTGWWCFGGRRSGVVGTITIRMLSQIRSWNGYYNSTVHTSWAMQAGSSWRTCTMDRLTLLRIRPLGVRDVDISKTIPMSTKSPRDRTKGLHAVERPSCRRLPICSRSVMRQRLEILGIHPWGSSPSVRMLGGVFPWAST